MSSIIVNSVYKWNAAPISVSISIIDRTNLDIRIQDFLRIRGRLEDLQNRESFLACRSLFQRENSELCFLPCLTISAPIDTVSNGDLTLLCIEGYGIILCFFPKRGTRTIPDRAIMSFFFKEEGSYPQEANNSPRLILNNNCISCLVCEGASIDYTSGYPVLRGLKITFLQVRNKSRSFLCQKLNQDFLSLERSYSVHPKYRRYVKISCYCKYKGFSCLVKIPVLSGEEIEEEIATAHHQRAQALNISKNNLFYAVVEKDLFPEDGVEHHLIGFPYAMGMDFPLCNTYGGDLFFSCIGNDLNSFRVVFISRSFREGQIEERNRGLENFPSCQIGSSIYTRSNACTKKLFSCSGPQAKIVHQFGDEYLVEGIRLQLISNHSSKTFFGLCLSRQQESIESIPGSIEGDSSSSPSGVVSHCPILGSRRSVGRIDPFSETSRPHPYSRQTSRSQLAVATSLPLEIEGQQLGMVSQDHSYSLLPLIFSIRPSAVSSSWPYPTSQGQASSTVSVPQKRQRQQQPSMVSQNYLRDHSYSLLLLASSVKPSATVSVPPERQGQQQAQTGFQVPLSTGSSVFFPPLASSVKPPTGSSCPVLGESYSLYSLNQGQPEATTSVPPERQGQQQTQMSLQMPLSMREDCNNSALQGNIIPEETNLNLLKNLIESCTEEEMLEACLQEDFDYFPDE